LSLHGIPYWLDYATLLNHLRDQQLNRWEQDVDLSIIDPDFMASLRHMPLLPKGETVGPALDASLADPLKPGLALNREHLMRKFREAGFRTTYDQKRQLVQLWGPNVIGDGPHVDLWLWAPIPADSTKDTPYPSTHPAKPYAAEGPLPVLTTLETNHFRPRPLSVIFPLQSNVSWLGVEGVSVPAQKHVVADKEFGHYGGSYMTAQVFRGDCFHNFFHLRFAY
jgi:hypothetical protein